MFMPFPSDSHSFGGAASKAATREWARTNGVGHLSVRKPQACGGLEPRLAGGLCARTGPAVRSAILTLKDIEES